VDWSPETAAAAVVDFAKWFAVAEAADRSAPQDNYVPAADLERNSEAMFGKLVCAVLHMVLAVGPCIAAVGIGRSVVPDVVRSVFPDVHHCGVLDNSRDSSHDRAR
jgi:hypothetical protein